MVLGQAAFAKMQLGLHLMRRAEYISDYDVVVGVHLAKVLSGGENSTRRSVCPNNTCWIWSEAFVSLCGQKKTMERMQYMLKKGEAVAELARAQRQTDAQAGSIGGIIVGPSLDIQVLHVERVLFDKLAARLHVIAHQISEDALGFQLIFHAHLQQRTLLGVHRGLPKLVGIHFAQTLEALHCERFLALGHDVLEQLLAVLNGNAAAVRGDQERRDVVGAHATVEVERATVVRAPNEFPIDNALSLILS